MNPIDLFRKQREDIRTFFGADPTSAALSRSWMNHAQLHKYSYQFDWLSRPIIQYPQDIVAMQEIIWTVKPDLIIETGIAHGGSLVFSASMLAMIELAEAIELGAAFDPRRPTRHVIGIDIDIRPHNRAAIERHPFAGWIDLLQGSSVDRAIIEAVHERARRYSRVLVCLDSLHTHEHVLAELEAYAPLTSKDSYCVVFDTMIENMPAGIFEDRPWGPGDNPKTAVREYLNRLQKEGRKSVDGKRLRFEPDEVIEGKLLITVAPEGYLRRI